MARKSTPLPLTLADASIVDDEHGFLHSPTSSPLTSKSPKSTISPYIFTTKKGAQSQGEEPPQMQPADPQQKRTNPMLPPSQTSPSLSALQQSSAASSGRERQERERPARSGFFSNYKASKSSSRLQPSDTGRPVTEGDMSRETDRPALSGQVLSQETNCSGTIYLVLPLFYCLPK
jgi:hypothetical protein